MDPKQRDSIALTTQSGDAVMRLAWRITHPA
jgi:hypothetical protein